LKPRAPQSFVSRSETKLPMSPWDTKWDMGHGHIIIKFVSILSTLDKIKCPCYVPVMSILKIQNLLCNLLWTKLLSRLCPCCVLRIPHET
jgi:hypothetical protein